MFRLDRRSTFLALIVACAFGTARADDEPAPEPAPEPAKPADVKPATVKGSVIDNNTKVGLPAATIQIKGPAGDQTIATELDGTFTFTLAPGTYKITFSTAEYLEQTRTVTVATGQSLTIDLNLDPVPATSSETIVVVDKIDTRKESAVLAVRRAAPTVSDAVSSQEIQRTPDSNAGDAMKRVVAVSVVDGKYVALRGLEGRYVTALLNGVLLPSPEPDRNAVPLDLFPTSLLSTMTVVKSYLPDLPGQFGGGTLSIDTSSFPTKFEFKLGVTTSANTVSTGQDGLTNANSRGFRSFLGFDNGSRAFPSAIPKNRAVRDMDAAETERIGEAMPNVWTPKGETVTPNLGVTATVGNTTKLGGKRLGYLASGMIRRNFSERDGQTAGVGMSADGIIQTDNLDYSIGIAEATVGGLVNAGLDITPNDEISVLGLYTHVGEDTSQTATGYKESDASDIAVSRLSFVERSLAFTQVRGKHLLNRSKQLELRWQGNFAKTARNELDTRDLVYSIDNVTGTRSYQDQPGSGQHFWQELRDTAGGGGADLKFRVSDHARVQLGAMSQLSNRALGGRRFRFRFVGNSTTVRNLPAEMMFDQNNIGSEFELEEGTLHEDSYKAALNIHGAYALSEVELHPKFRVIGGARVETARQEMTNGSRYAIAGLQTEVDRNDTDVLPAANFVYSPRPDTNLRAAYSYTLTRPRFRELAPFLFFDYVRRRDISGNPNLLTTHIHNADLRWEWFPSDDEVFAASVFYKQFVDPIEQVIANVNADATFRNADSGNLMGGEIEARTTLGRIDPSLRRFRVATNVAVMRSRVELGADQMLLTSKSRPLYGQSPFVVNLSVGYVNPKVADINVLYNVIGPRISDVGIEGLPDTYERPVHRVDLVMARQMSKDVRLKLSATNLLDQAVRQETGSIAVNVYDPGVSVALGLDWTPK